MYADMDWKWRVFLLSLDCSKWTRCVQTTWWIWAWRPAFKYNGPWSTWIFVCLQKFRWNFENIPRRRNVLVEGKLVAQFPTLSENWCARWGALKNASPMQAAQEPLNLRNLNQRGCKQGNINPMVCAQRFLCFCKRSLVGLNNRYCLRGRLNAVFFKNSKWTENRVASGERCFAGNQDCWSISRCVSSLVETVWGWRSSLVGLFSWMI